MFLLCIPSGQGYRFHANANPSKRPLHPRYIYAIHPVSRQRHHIQLEADEDASPTVLSRVQAFLPELAASNADLLQRAREDPSSVDIESVNAEDPQYIEMVRTHIMHAPCPFPPSRRTWRRHSSISHTHPTHMRLLRRTSDWECSSIVASRSRASQLPTWTSIGTCRCPPQMMTTAMVPRPRPPHHQIPLQIRTQARTKMRIAMATIQTRTLTSSLRPPHNPPLRVPSSPCPNAGSEQGSRR